MTNKPCRSRAAKAFAVFLGFSAFSAAFMAGCESPISPVETHEVKDGTKGFVIASEKYRISVSVPPDAYADGGKATLVVYSRQFPEVAEDGYAVSETGAAIELDVSNLAPGKGVDISVGFSQPTYSADRVHLALENEAGVPAFLEERLEGGTLRAVASSDLLKSLDTGSDGRERFRVYFVAELETALPGQAFSSRTFYWKSGAWSETPVDLSGKSVCVLVHGLMSSAADLKDLASAIARDAAGTHDAVMAFEYSSSAGIGVIGDEMASKLLPILSKASRVDLVAHSLGNLVSRRAIVGSKSVKGLDGTVSRYVSLGGPQEGVPFGNITVLANLAYLLKRIDAVEGTMGLLRDLCTDGVGGKSLTGFLETVNGVKASPIPVLSVSGDHYRDYYIGKVPVGWTFETLYFLSGYVIPQDGIVAKYSAQSDKALDAFASPRERLHFSKNHGNLIHDPEVLAAIASWLKGNQ